MEDFWGVVIRGRVEKIRGHGQVGTCCGGGRVEAKTRGRVDLKDGVARVFQGNRWVRWYSGVLTEAFTNLFQDPAKQVLSTPCVRGKSTPVRGAEADTPQIIVGASFGQAAIAGAGEGKAHLLVLREFRNVTS